MERHGNQPAAWKSGEDFEKKKEKKKMRHGKRRSFERKKKKWGFPRRVWKMELRGNLKGEEKKMKRQGEV